MFGIAGYRPVVTDTVGATLSTHGPNLRALLGRRLDSVLGLCFTVDGQWCSTYPLILDFGGTRLELVFDGFDQLYLSWNTIDSGVPIDTADPADPADSADPDPDLALAWADPGRPELDAVLGAAVQQVAVLENDFHLDRVDGQRAQAWLLAGLELVFDNGRKLQLYNVFSETTLELDTPESERRRREILG
ncbi:hypothetical protein HDA40_006056 [Hamadaea flava]|uniref:Uncharacterized protein n=1 Tax=Hamadaea flava TaxID=1742688 RepID=A0ABV8LVS1_9ACTN|nr:hypothetical protein [Hamadaea flava]MCP2327549.1 hypothetical protein [Hamadaea flava]